MWYCVNFWWFFIALCAPSIYVVVGAGVGAGAVCCGGGAGNCGGIGGGGGGRCWFAFLTMLRKDSIRFS